MCIATLCHVPMRYASCDLRTWGLTTCHETCSLQSGVVSEPMYVKKSWPDPENCDTVRPFSSWSNLHQGKYS
jgi:hypothetical protein